MDTKRMMLRVAVVAMLAVIASCGGSGGGGGTPAPASLMSIAVTPANPAIATGATQQFSARGTYSDGSTQDLTSTATWNSSDVTRATIDAAGLATASSSAAGTSMVTATRGGVSGNALLEVVVFRLPRTNQTACYDAAGTVIACANTGQDGELQKGVAWPSPRFVDNADGTITDNLTGLMWLKDANCIKTYDAAHAGAEFDKDATVGDGEVSWQHAFDFVKGMNAGTYAPCAAGHQDWRVPNVNEMLSLSDYSNFAPALQTGMPFANISSSWNYWSSTSASANGAWAVSLYLGTPVTFAKGFWERAVWPVRGTTNGMVHLQRTGQTACYDNAGNVISCIGTGQDGELQAGITQPSVRFTNNGDGTITDNLTGLMWLRDANCATTASYDPDGTGNGSVTWQNALNFAKGVNAGTYPACSVGHTDWRIPNVVEMISLSNPNQDTTLTWLTSAGFSNLQNGLHWSSTTGVDLPNGALIMYSSNAVWPRDPKNNTYFFWLVR